MVSICLNFALFRSGTPIFSLVSCMTPLLVLILRMIQVRKISRQFFTNEYGPSGRTQKIIHATQCMTHNCNVSLRTSQSSSYIRKRMKQNTSDLFVLPLQWRYSRISAQTADYITEGWISCWPNRTQYLSINTVLVQEFFVVYENFLTEIPLVRH